MAFLSCGFGSDVGRVRDHNEDSCVVDPQLGLWLITDGMGGHQGGEIASAIVGMTVHQAVGRGTDLTEAIQQAHQAVLDTVRLGNGARGMGATVVALRQRGLDYEIAWVGDSRAYLWDAAERALSQLTHDHSYVQWLVDRGDLSAAEAAHHPQSHIVLQALGALDRQQLRVSRTSGQWQQGQRILLCSDGLSGELDDVEIEHILGGTGSEQSLVDDLIRAALTQGGRDNISAIVVSAPDGAPAPAKLDATQPQIDPVPVRWPSMSVGHWLQYIAMLALGLLLIGLALYLA